MDIQKTLKRIEGALFDDEPIGHLDQLIQTLRDVEDRPPRRDDECQRTDYGLGRAAERTSG